MERVLYQHIIDRLDEMDRKLTEVDERTKRIETEQAKQNESPGDRQLRRMLPGGFS
ncbi:hypothetical protein J0K78_06335 [Halobacillus sp. GSS1]|uniref:hypothetical protein n=1 Tax=Halobacillus sp. GSS1 TaxID=2815919 RepID=UPI001A8E6524|nr:hypothetical protein [Halobacillus sp. GSS1]MBN9653878.1 hypothetical protein [Halobacillus sp. GSS1]